MKKPFIDGYMYKEAELSDFALLGMATLGLAILGPAAAGLGGGYMVGKYGPKKSTGVMNKQLQQQELQELRNELAFNKKLSAYKNKRPEPKKKEIHI